MKIVFMGTPDFSKENLEALVESGYEVALVLTMPDRKKGRGYELSFSPVKTYAIEKGIEVLQPIKMKDEDLIQKLKSVEADVFVVVAYGKLLPREILDIPAKACINVHASLLPSYRGAAPIQWAIIDGIKKTGITTMLMDTGLDTGDILKKYELSIDEKETSGSLFDKLAKLGKKAILDTLENLDLYLKNKETQPETDTEYASMLSKEDGLLDFSKSSIVLERLIRGLNPWPSAYSYLDNKNLKIWEADLVDDKIYNKLVLPEYRNIYGKLIIDKEKIYVICKDSLLEIISIQLEGKKRMLAKDFIKGYRFNTYILGKQ